MPIHLRGETCSLRTAFRNWLLFTAAVAAVPLAYFGWNWFYFVHTFHHTEPLPEEWWTGWRFWLREWLAMIGPGLLGPELKCVNIIDRYRFPQIFGFVDKSLLYLALFAARLCVVFAWGTSRLQRGKHAPYAETLWLLVICALSYMKTDGSLRFYAIQALLAITGIVIFTLQRLRSPAWKWKMPE